MGATPVYAFPYPGVNDSPNGPTQVQALATALETKVIAIDAAHAAVQAQADALPRGRVASTNSATTSLTTAEAAVDLFTVTLVSGRRYRMTGCYVYGSASTTNYFFKMRYQTGTTGGLGGTIFNRIAPNGVTGSNLPVTFTGEFVAPSSGTFTVSITCLLGSGTGSIPNDGTNHVKFACLDDIGL